MGIEAELETLGLNRLNFVIVRERMRDGMYNGYEMSTVLAIARSW